MYKYDLAVGIPVYSLTKNKTKEEVINRLRDYTYEIKNLFPRLKVQVIFSNNSTLDINELEIIDDVKVVNNNGNVFAFNARKSAFENSDAFYYWTIDDDVGIITNSGVDIEGLILQNIGNENLILGNKGNWSCVWLTIIPSTLMRRLYDIIGHTPIKTNGEDNLPYFAARSLMDKREPIGVNETLNFFSFLNQTSAEFDSNVKKSVDIDRFLLMLLEEKRICGRFLDLKGSYDFYSTHLNFSQKDKLKFMQFLNKNK